MPNIRRTRRHRCAYIAQSLQKKVLGLRFIFLSHRLKVDEHMWHGRRVLPRAHAGELEHAARRRHHLGVVVLVRIENHLYVCGWGEKGKGPSVCGGTGREWNTSSRMQRREARAVPLCGSVAQAWVAAHIQRQDAAGAENKGNATGAPHRPTEMEKGTDQREDKIKIAGGGDLGQPRLNDELGALVAGEKRHVDAAVVQGGGVLVHDGLCMRDGRGLERVWDG